ncbi:hypothetical protein Ssi03_62440 [Sphaerisporangium siamense]|uniref:Putative nucleic acid-binding Zn-ribbon protein n=1 Tax=Sphaerisporangium siamense TaxID=795645 RepID=A0A7W7D948_9ACTN|nr:hypothetical protein [Sphaerisporangium siamense]MBB4702554.1 putative nucleic acid-binding Zn-ribbon protein [Sphaerisporangium siamense]GII88254.1 hypothetical protein Ssi03_62440 [Sphaerisporangium siamense]
MNGPLEAIVADPADDELLDDLARRYLAYQYRPGTRPEDLLLERLGPVLVRLRLAEARETRSLQESLAEHQDLLDLKAELAAITDSLREVRAQRDALLALVGVSDLRRTVLIHELVTEADLWRAQAYAEADKVAELRDEVHRLRAELQVLQRQNTSPT